MASATSRIGRYIVLAAAVVLVASACGDDEGSETTQTTAATVTTATTAATATTAPSATTATTEPAGGPQIELPAEQLETGKIVSAATLAYAPFEFIAEDGSPTGASVEVQQAMAEVLGLELEFIEIPFTSIFPSIASGRADYSCCAYSVTEERLEQVDFVTLMRAGHVVAALPEVAPSITDQFDLCGLKLAVNAGSTADFVADDLSQDCVDAGLDPIEEIQYPTSNESVNAVLSGRADARLDDVTVAGYYEVTSEGALVVTDSGMYESRDAGLVVPKGNLEMAEALQAALQVLMDNGTLAEIFDEYGLRFAALDEAALVTSIDDM